MNKFVYTITTVLFIIIAGTTAYMMLEKEPTEPKTAVVAEVEPEPVEEPVEEVHYYKYTVKDARWLHIRAMQGMDNDPVGKLPRGYTGYVVKMTGHWTLVCAEGYIGYCSDTYLELEEIEESAFPEELKGYDETAAGTTIAEGRIGEVEEANTKSAKWL